MNIADNVLKHHLRNVYWIAGTNCGGKTTMSKYLAKKYEMVVYDADSKFMEHKSIGSIYEQPAMLRHFIDYEWFFNRPIEEYTKWILESEEEQMIMIVLDLISIAKDNHVIVDVHCFPEILKRISSFNKVVFLLTNPKFSREEYFDRDDKRDMYECIMSLSSPQKTLSNVLDLVENVASIEYKYAITSGFKCFLREENSTIEGTAKMIEQHFNLV